MKKKNKRLITVFGLLLVAIVGATFAYFQTSASFVNIFNTGTYRVVTTEEFVGPENWAPGQEIPKTITSTNEGTIPAAVRVSYTEQWLKEIDGVETDITNQITNGTVIINLDNTSEWIQEGNYYYYKYILDPTKTTSSFIKSVTLNPNMNGATCIASQDGLTQTCESNNPALGATYKLTITKETVQADKYQEVWNTNVSITEKPPIVAILSGTKGNLQPGDMVGIGETEDFYVLSSDNSPNGKTLLIAKYNLLVGSYFVEDDFNHELLPIQTNTPGYGLQSEDAIGYKGYEGYGLVQFSHTNYWSNNNQLKNEYATDFNGNPASYSGNPYPYVYNENSDIYSYISGENGYLSKLIEMGAPNTITGRILSHEELINYENIMVNDVSILYNGEISYWLGSVDGNITVEIMYTFDGSSGYCFTDYDNNEWGGVRPVIEIKTSDIG